jgi:predicted Zn-ribbon and HTH transcriptional regulator
MAQFMRGRNGADRLFYILTVGYVVLMFLNVFLHSTVVYLIGLAMFALAIFRFFSKNIVKRSKENEAASRVYYSALGKINKTKNRSKQNKTYCFKRCPNCGKTLRLPRVKGKHGTRCPACGCEFSVRIFIDKKAS